MKPNKTPTTYLLRTMPEDKFFALATKVDDERAKRLKAPDSDRELLDIVGGKKQ